MMTVRRVLGQLGCSIRVVTLELQSAAHRSPFETIYFPVSSLSVARLSLSAIAALMNTVFFDHVQDSIDNLFIQVLMQGTEESP